MEPIVVAILAGAGGAFIAGLLVKGYSKLKAKALKSENKIDDEVVKIFEEAIKELNKKEDKENDK